MPRIDGYETCWRLRQQLWRGDVVIVALTGYGQADDRMRAQATGFDEYRVKPVDLTLLPDLLIQLIDKKKAPGSKYRPVTHSPKNALFLGHFQNTQRHAVFVLVRLPITVGEP